MTLESRLLEAFIAELTRYFQAKELARKLKAKKR